MRERTMDDLNRLAALLKEKHVIDEQIARIVGRPAQIGHTGEYIAAAIFNIRLEPSAVAKGIDGHFTTGQPAGRSVNVKWYTKLEHLLDITPRFLPDDYLVLTGPRSQAMSSRGTHRPWHINYVFLFDAGILIKILTERGTAIGVASRVPRQYWDAAEIYPMQRNPRLPITEIQRAQLALFGA